MFGYTKKDRVIHVLIVDDSAVVRQVMMAILSQEKEFSVVTAGDPFIAMDKMRRQRPDVIVLDLEMPRMDGLTFLHKIMKEDPTPVVVCSGLAEEGSEAAFRAIEAGAVDIVTKPNLGVGEFLHESAVILVDSIKGAAKARLKRSGVLPQPLRQSPAGLSPLSPLQKRLLTVTTDKVIAMGTSTGGTEALRVVLETLTPEIPGLVIVQHMPEHFTKGFAQRLNQICEIEVKEAANGDRVISGRALIAPGNRHMTLVSDGGHYSVEIGDGPLVSRHRPSVDVLFGSVAKSAGQNAVGVIMTGMGDDGAEGLCEMKKRGASTIAQDEESCVVFGMPREAIVRGGVDEIVPLTKISQTILKQLSSKSSRKVRQT